MQDKGIRKGRDIEYDILTIEENIKDMKYYYCYDYSFSLRYNESQKKFFCLNKEDLKFWCENIRRKCLNQNFSQDFTILNKLGEGSTAKVYKVQSKYNKKFHACKIFEKSMIALDYKLKDSITFEVKIMRYLKNDKIVELNYIYEDENRIYLVMELITGYKMLDYLRKHGKFTEDQAKFIIKDLLTILQCLEQSKIIHRDIKPENVMLIYHYPRDNRAHGSPKDQKGYEGPKDHESPNGPGDQKGHGGPKGHGDPKGYGGPKGHGGLKGDGSPKGHEGCKGHGGPKGHEDYKGHEGFKGHVEYNSVNNTDDDDDDSAIAEDDSDDNDDIKDEERISIKLIDFGHSTGADFLDTSYIYGTPGYIAPEMFEDGIYGHKVDIFSLGVMLYLMLTGRKPFRGQTKQITMSLNRNAILTFDDIIWKSISQDAQNLIKSMTIKDPKFRLSCEEALKHSWFDEKTIFYSLATNHEDEDNVIIEKNVSNNKYLDSIGSVIEHDNIEKKIIEKYFICKPTKLSKFHIIGNQHIFSDIQS